MLDRLFKRTWVSTITALSFIVIVISGMMMLFHIRVPFVDPKLLHISMGLVFVAVGTIHLILNWGTLTAYFRMRSAVIALALGIILCVTLLLFAGRGEAPGNGGPQGRGGNHGAGWEVAH